MFTSFDANAYFLCVVSVLSIDVRFKTKSFLWADDLSSMIAFINCLSIFHFMEVVSLFPILASIAIFFNMKKMTTGDLSDYTPPQEGMPDMGKIMKL